MAVSAPSSERSTCHNCGAHVSEQFGRVFGDEDDEVHRCGRCDSWSRIYDGSAAGREVVTPDPEEHPERSASGQFGWSA